MRVLIFDPAGNASKSEGYGVTGWALFEDGVLKDFGRIESKDFPTQEMYWLEHTLLIAEKRPNELVCESYKLFAHKSAQQSWSTMDTPQLLGYLRMYCWNFDIPVYFQDPADKIRVTDPILVKLGIIEKRGNKHYCLNRPTVIHSRDAIRHGVYFHRFGKGKEYVKK